MSFALDEETEALAAALSYLDDFPSLQSGALLLDVEPPPLDGSDWLGGKALGRTGGKLEKEDEDGDEEDEDEDPTALLDALSSSSLLDFSLGEVVTKQAAPSPPPCSSDSSRDAGQSSGEESQQTIAPSRLQQLRQQTVLEQTLSTHNRMVIPSTSSASKALTNAAKKAAGKKPLNYNPNRARDERRQELIYLRQKVKEMEEQLASIKANQPNGGGAALRLGQKRPLTATSEPTHDRSTIVRSACTGNVKGSGASDSTQYFVPKVWQDMCARQLEQRIKAERENIRLKLILEGQIKIAKSMEKLLKKRETLRVSSRSQSVWRVTLTRSQLTLCSIRCGVNLLRPWRRAAASAQSAFICRQPMRRRTRPSTTS